MEVIAGRPDEARGPQVFVFAAVALLVVGVMGSAVPIASSQTGTENPKSSKPPTILFMCPHGAAKSVLASAYFQRRAKERGLPEAGQVSGGMAWIPVVGSLLVYASPRRFSRAMAL